MARQLAAARRVVFLCGAGLSVPSGIRACRSGPSAIWAENVLAWGTFQKFSADPALWWREFWLKAHGDLFRSFTPNAGHHALGRFMGRGHDDLVITQNIDGLLFDESYDSHGDFQAWRGKKALNDADVLVFVGTSFSVGITHYAVRCAEVSGAKLINVNVEPSPFPQMVNVLGGAEVLLPQLLG